MTEYFTGHKDCTAINEYLNAVGEGSKDFKVVYGIRKIGEAFVAGTLTLDEVRSYTREVFDENLPFNPSVDIEYRGASPESIAFIRQMRCMTFYSAICHIGTGTLLTPFEMKIKQEIVHPAFCKPIPTGKLSFIIYKMQQIWHTRWKHPLVYKEWWLPAMVTWLWSVVRRQRIVKD